MFYRKMPRIEEELSILGFGCMRLPSRDGKIDMPAAKTMMDKALEGGINVVDTAFLYHRGFSETFVGEALEGRRKKVFLISKAPVWLMEKPEDLDKYLDEQLAKMRTDYLDAYLMHGLNNERWEKLKRLNVQDFFIRAKESGKIRYVGFSFHDGLNVFKKIADGYPWDLCLIQLNIMDSEFQAGIAGLKYAAERDIGVAVMEPLRGGFLAAPVPAELEDAALKAGYREPDLRSLCFRWLWEKPEVSIVLSGMSTLEQMEANLALVNNLQDVRLTPAEAKFAKETGDFLRTKLAVPCTGCAYCMPCPQKISISDCFRFFNAGQLSGDFETQKRVYNFFILELDKKNVAKASECISCGECSPKCPQGIDIPAKLRDVVEKFES